MASAFCDKLLAYDVAPEDWRKPDVSIGEPAASVACAALQLSIKIAHLEWFPDVNDIGRELDKGYMDGTKPTSGDAYVAGFSLAGLFDCKRAEAQV